MRKALMLAAALAGIGGLMAAARASQDGPTQTESAQATTHADGFRKADREGAARDDRSHEAHEQDREERKGTHEKEDRD
jgi:hypothetical protein